LICGRYGRLALQPILAFRHHLGDQLVAQSRQPPVVCARMQIAVGHMGVAGLMKTIALANAQSGVARNAICPVWVKTPPAALR
jgi:NAD(P)-dependent dehydrogenase (short-subunit alcohol dehydrogenase family)